MIPPIGVKINNEMNGTPDTIPNNAAEPLISRTYIGSAKLSIILPNKDMICPKTNREKSLFQSLFDTAFIN